LLIGRLDHRRLTGSVFGPGSGPERAAPPRAPWQRPADRSM